MGNPQTINNIKYCLLLQIFLEPKVAGEARANEAKKEDMGQVMPEQRESVELEANTKKELRMKCNR